MAFYIEDWATVLSTKRRLILLSLWSALGCASSAPTNPPSPKSGTVDIHLSSRPVLDFGTQSQDRPACKSIMVLPGEGPGLIDAATLSLLEGNLMQHGLRVISAAITGRVVSDGSSRDGQTGPRVEGATQLTPLERALILAQRAEAACVFELLEMELSKEASRYYVWEPNASALVESNRSTYDRTPMTRRWLIFGPELRVRGKLIDVKSGAVLAIVGLESSTPFAVEDRTIALPESGGHLLRQSGHFGWRLNSANDRGRVLSALMSQLAGRISGQSPPPH